MTSPFLVFGLLQTFYHLPTFLMEESQLQAWFRIAREVMFFILEKVLCTKINLEKVLSTLQGNQCVLYTSVCSLYQILIMESRCSDKYRPNEMSCRKIILLCATKVYTLGFTCKQLSTIENFGLQQCKVVSLHLYICYSVTFRSDIIHMSHWI